MTEVQSGGFKPEATHSSAKKSGVSTDSKVYRLIKRLFGGIFKKLRASSPLPSRKITDKPPSSSTKVDKARRYAWVKPRVERKLAQLPSGALPKEFDAGADETQREVAALLTTANKSSPTQVEVPSSGAESKPPSLQEPHVASSTEPSPPLQDSKPLSPREPTSRGVPSSGVESKPLSLREQQQLEALKAKKQAQAVLDALPQKTEVFLHTLNQTGENVSKTLEKLDLYTSGVTDPREKEEIGAVVKGVRAEFIKLSDPKEIKKRVMAQSGNVIQQMNAYVKGAFPGFKDFASWLDHQGQGRERYEVTELFTFVRQADEIQVEEFTRVKPEQTEDPFLGKASKEEIQRLNQNAYVHHYVQNELGFPSFEDWLKHANAERTCADVQKLVLGAIRDKKGGNDPVRQLAFKLACQVGSSSLSRENFTSLKDFTDRYEKAVELLFEGEDVEQKALFLSEYHAGLCAQAQEAIEFPLSLLSQGLSAHGFTTYKMRILSKIPTARLRQAALHKGISVVTTAKFEAHCPQFSKAVRDHAVQILKNHSASVLKLFSAKVKKEGKKGEQNYYTLQGGTEASYQVHRALAARQEPLRAADVPTFLDSVFGKK